MILLHGSNFYLWQNIFVDRHSCIETKMKKSGNNDNDNNISNTHLFKSLDFLYVPASDIDASVHYYTKVLDGKLLWKIHQYTPRLLPNLLNRIFIRFVHLLSYNYGF